MNLIFANVLLFWSLTWFNKSNSLCLLLRKLNGLFWDLWEHGQIFKSQWSLWRYSLRNMEYLILESAEQWMRSLQDLSNQKPQNHSSQNLQLLLNSSCLYSLIMLPDTSPFLEVGTTSGPGTDLDTLPFKRTSKPGKGLKRLTRINAIPETLCSCGWQFGYDKYIFAGLAVLIYRLTKKLCFNKWVRAVFHLAQWHSYDLMSTFVCLCCMPERVIMIRLLHLLVLGASGTSGSGELREPISSYSEIQLSASLPMAVVALWKADPGAWQSDLSMSSSACTTCSVTQRTGMIRRLRQYSHFSPYCFSKHTSCGNPFFF